MQGQGYAFIHAVETFVVLIRELQKCDCVVQIALHTEHTFNEGHRMNRKCLKRKNFDQYSSANNLSS